MLLLLQLTRQTSFSTFWMETSCVPPLTFLLQLTADRNQRQCFDCSSFHSVFAASRRECTANTRLRTDSSKTSKQCAAFQTHNGRDHQTAGLEKPAGKSSQGSRPPAHVHPVFPQSLLGIKHAEEPGSSLEREERKKERKCDDVCCTALHEDVFHWCFTGIRS